MARLQSAYRGCLLGLAVGDAMGYTVDSRTLSEIREDYGPHGLLGYDLVNGYADTTSYTQIAAFTCNSLLLGFTRGQLQGKMAPLVRYIGLGFREWTAGQRLWGRPERTFCWLLQQPELCRRRCMDTRMQDTLGREQLGTPEEPINNYFNPGSITAAVGVGLFAQTLPMEEIDHLGAEAMALTHGSPLAFLSGALLTHIIQLALTCQMLPTDELFAQSLEALEQQYGASYPRTEEVCTVVRRAIALSEDPSLSHTEAMEQIQCETAAQVVAGAVYACLTCNGDFDTAMITAVNHSGRSAAVGAVTGAILGARMGADALPEFYLECLEPAEVLLELADDLYHGCPMERGGKLFDDDWDRKYLRGGK